MAQPFASILKLLFLALISLSAFAASADMYDQIERANRNPNLELLDSDSLFDLQSITAPGSIFSWDLCDPPGRSGSYLCTQLPLDYDKPFTDFPVVLRFYDQSDAQSVAKYRIESRLNDFDAISHPHFFLLDMQHGKVDVRESGEATYSPINLNSIPVMKPGEHYRSSMKIAIQGGGGFLKLLNRIVVPEGTVLYRPRAMGMIDRERKWRKCDGEMPRVKPNDNTLSGAERDSRCDARYGVRLFGERSKKWVVSYVFYHKENFNSGPRYRTLDQTFRISPKDPVGLYTFEWWYAGKLLTQTRFEIRR